MFNAYAADSAEGKLKPFEYDPGALRPDQVEIDVAYCGICHSDLSMLTNHRVPVCPGARSRRADLRRWRQRQTSPRGPDRGSRMVF